VRAVTIRRLLVFGVCAFGVGCLYLMPSVARSPDGVSSLRSDDQRSRPAAGKPATVQSTGPAVADDEESRSLSPEPTASPKPTTSPPSRTDSEPDPTSQPNRDSERDTTSYQDTTSQGDKTERRQPTPGGATAFDPVEEKRDDTPPDPVRGIRFSAITPDDLTIRWAPSQDDNAVVGYQVWLDGFQVATTTRTRATVNWFNDDIGEHVVQVRAFDSAGNESRATEILLVRRPTPEPSPTPSPKPSPTPSATASPNVAPQSTDSE
jgi:hypothetical protein